MNKLFTRILTLMGLVIALTLLIYSGVSAGSAVALETEEEECRAGIATTNCDHDDECEASVDANGVLTTDDDCGDDDGDQCDDTNSTATTDDDCGSDDDNCEQRAGIYTVLTEETCQEDGEELAAPTGLTIVGDLNALPLAITFTWTHKINDTDTEVPGDWYQLVIVQRRGNMGGNGHRSAERYGNVVFNLWFEANKICSGVVCAVGFDNALTDYLYGSFNNDTFLWLVRSWTGPDLPGTYSEWSEESEFDVTIPQPDVTEGITVTTLNGRPVIIIPRDRGVSWANIAIVGTTEAGEPYFHMFWYKLNRRNCNFNACLVYPFAFPVNGTYQAWVQLWGPGGFGKGRGLYAEWYGPYDFTIDLDEPGFPDGMTTTPGTGGGHHHFHWHKLPRASWFNIWIGTSDFSETAFYGWVEAIELECEDGECNFELPEGITLNPNKSYTWYIQAWGPGGFSQGGEDGWKHGGNFTPGG